MRNHTKVPHELSCLQERPLVAAVRQALPYVLGLGLGLATIQPAASRSNESAAAFTATQLVRQFTLKNTVSQVATGMQGYVEDGVIAPAMGARPPDFPADMGTVPLLDRSGKSVNLPRRDGAGRPLGYCAWDNNTTITSAAYNAGPSTLLYAVVSPGLNGVMQTTCASVLATGSGVGDDYVQVVAPMKVSSASYKSSVATFADLPAGEQGDIRLVRDTNTLYSFNGVSWQAVGGSGGSSTFADDSAANGAGAISYTTGKVTVADFQATAATLTGALNGTSATFSGAVTANTFIGNGSGLTDLNAGNLTSGTVSAARGGTGVDASAAGNGTLLIGNGSGFTLGTISAGAGISVLNSAGAITISNSGVVSIAGTANQVIASSSNGAVTLSLPQNIDASSTPTFSGLTLNDLLLGTSAAFSGDLSAARLHVGTNAGVTNPNLIIGNSAMPFSQNGNGDNTVVGIGAMLFNSSGSANTAVGADTLTGNTGGSRNTALGVTSGVTNTTGSNNTFLGASADATTGALNFATAIGSGSQVATSNTIALGRNSFADQVVIGTHTRNDTYANTKLYVNGVTNLNGDLRGSTATFTGAVNAAQLFLNGEEVVAKPVTKAAINEAINPEVITFPNFAIGARTLQVNLPTGVANTAVGYEVLESNTDGDDNTGVGYQVLNLNTTGDFNSGLGSWALRDNTTGIENSAVGGYALLSNNTGSFNTAMGSAALELNTGGSYNSAFGFRAGDSNTTGTLNTFLGYESDAASPALTYATAIGSFSTVATSNTIALGRNTVTDQVVIGTSSRSGAHKLWVQGTAVVTGGVTTSSDRLLKTNVSALDVDAMLAKLGQFGAYRYNYISNPEAGAKIGVIAQELQALFPEIANYGSGDKYLSVDYGALGAMAAVGVGQLNNKFTSLNKTVNEQGEKLLELGGKVEKHDARIAVLESWKTDAVARMDGMQTAIDLNIQKIADHAVAIQTNTKAIERLDDALLTLDEKVKGNTDAIGRINERWVRNFSASEDGSLLTVNAVELKVSNFSAQKVRSKSVYAERLEAEMARIAELEVNNLRVANTVQAEQMNTGSTQVYAGAGMPALLFAAKADGHYTVSTSALDGSYAAAIVIVNAGQAKLVPISNEGIELIAVGNMVKAIAAGKSIRASWTKTG